MAVFLYGARMTMTLLLLIAVYQGSRIALVVLLALIVLSQEITASYARRVASALDATMLRRAAYEHGDRDPLKVH
jgi:hypothetical protein